MRTFTLVFQTKSKTDEDCRSEMLSLCSLLPDHGGVELVGSGLTPIRLAHEVIPRNFRGCYWMGFFCAKNENEITDEQWSMIKGRENLLRDHIGTSAKFSPMPKTLLKLFKEDSQIFDHCEYYLNYDKNSNALLFSPYVMGVDYSREYVTEVQKCYHPMASSYVIKGSLDEIVGKIKKFIETI